LHWQYDHHSTDESFHDLVLHNQGVSACGWVDASDVGRSLDGLGVNFDYNGNVQIDQAPIGGEKQEYLNVILNQSDEYAYLVGYNEVHTISGSGNNWHMGFRNRKLSSSSCTLKRAMYVDDVIDQDATGALLEGGNFDTQAKRSAIITYAKDKNFKTIFLYGVDILLLSDTDPNYTSIKNLVYDFIEDAMDDGLFVGFAIGGDLKKASSFQDYLDAFYWTRAQNYSEPEKLHFAVAEHEFWNIGLKEFWTNLKGTKTGPGDPSSTSYTATDWDNWYYEIFNDHLLLLDEMNNLKMSDCNFWKSVDYISYLHNLLGGFNADNTPLARKPNPDNVPSFYKGQSNHSQKDLNWLAGQADDITNRADYIQLVYYRNSNSYNSNGINFDWNFTTPSGYVFRMQAFSKNNLSPTILPLFSAEKTTCHPQGANWMGDWFLNHNGSLALAEDQFINGAPNIPTNGYEDYYNDPSIDNIQIGGFSWFTYSCLSALATSNQQSDIALLDCQPLNGHYDPVFKKAPTGITTRIVERNHNDQQVLGEHKASEPAEGLTVYPNPVSKLLYLNNIPASGIKSFSIYNSSGVLLMESDEFANPIDLSTFTNGVYYIKFVHQDDSNSIIKILKQ
jgi:hypothetical protein